MGVHKIGLLCTFVKAKSTNQNQSKYISLLLKVKKNKRTISVVVHREQFVQSGEEHKQQQDDELKIRKTKEILGMKWQLPSYPKAIYREHLRWNLWREEFRQRVRKVSRSGIH